MGTASTVRLPLWFGILLASMGCRGINPDYDPPSAEEESGTCGPEQLRCGNDCVDPLSDPVHCGDCDAPCADHELCDQGICGDAGCRDHEVVCGEECVDLDKDRVHCGMCDLPCAAEDVCAGGVCRQTCSGQFTPCGELCVETDLDPDNCGECDNVCALEETCVGGACE